MPLISIRGINRQNVTDCTRRSGGLLFSYAEYGTESPNHIIGVPTASVFVVTDHVLPDADFSSGFYLRQVGLRPRSGEQIAYPVFLHLLSECCFLDKC